MGALKSISKTYHAAVYLRLSREDGDVAEGGRAFSNSISNQKELVMDYLESRADIQVYSVYTDDGWSGVDFERPEFQRMLDDIREGLVDCVVVKDLSRFGRNYIESGRYIEKIFPMLGVRFIAVNDGYDSLDGQYGDDMVVPFKNLINDAYCRDISVKIRSHMEVKRKNGEYIGAFAAYGYLKDPEDKNHLVVDEYAAEVVRDIFAMKLAGCNVKAIADRLNRDGILSPLQYKRSIGIRMESPFQKGAEPKWSYNAVLRILKNEVYVGTVAQGKCTTPNYKVKKRVYKDKDEWIRVEDAHEAVVGRGEFDLVQVLLARDTRTAPEREKVFPLAGMVFCGGCGAPMVRKTVPSGGKRYVYYVCSGHKSDRASCSSHSFSAKKLEESVLALVQTFIGKVLALSEAADIVSRTSGMELGAGKIESRIGKLREEAENCGRRRKNLYEDFKDGILTKEEYAMLREQYQEQAAGIEASIVSLEKERDGILAGRTAGLEWVESLKRYEGVERLDRGLAAFLIDRIAVMGPEALEVAYRFGKEAEEMERFVLEHGKEAV
nr:recombinase family protein [uncultured Acetatifactor sp.]